MWPLALRARLKLTLPPCHPRYSSKDEIEAIDLIEEIGLELGYEYLQAPGEITFINNHVAYHGRTAWKYSYADEGNERDNEDNGRLLLRAWVSPYNSRALPDTQEYRTVWGDVRGGQPRGGWDQAVKTGDSPKPSIPSDHKYYSLFDDRVQHKSMTEHCNVVLKY